MSARLFQFDQGWREKGFSLLAGVDEVGIGPLAGPVVAAAVILKPEARLKGLNDSKQVLPARREELFGLIQESALAWAVAVVDHGVVDALNILQASFVAVRRAVQELARPPDLVLFDGCRRIPRCSLPQETIVKGDAKSACIAAASILAKVTRDRLMAEAHTRFPHYGFDENKGYGTASHIEALRRHGPCDIHRRSYQPVIDAITPVLPLFN